MTDWVSAKEALWLLGEHRKEDPKGDLIARAAAGAKTRAGGLWRDDQHIWENQPLNYRFWGAMRTHSTIQNWDASEFAYSVCDAKYPASDRRSGGESHFERELLEWRATGVEFCWTDVAEALELEPPPKSVAAPNEFFDAWFNPHRETLWGEEKIPGDKLIRQWFSGFCKRCRCNYHLKKSQMEEVRRAWPSGSERAPRGRRKQGPCAQ